MSFTGAPDQPVSLQETIDRIQNITGESIKRMSASDAELESVRAVLGLDELPDDLRRIYSWQNGGPIDIHGKNSFWRMIPASDVVEIVSYWREYNVSVALPPKPDAIDLEIFDTLPPKVMPMFDWNASIYGLVDFREGVSGPVIGFNLEADKISFWSDSLANFMARVAENFESQSVLSIDDLQQSAY